MKKYKQLIVVFLVGVLVGAMLFSIGPVSAAIEEYICYKADYKLIINGAEFVNPEQPLLNYKGITYAPVKTILEKAGFNVTWNAELQQTEATSNPTSAQINNVEENTMSTSIEYDNNTGLPVGATATEYKGCPNAVLYNGNIYLSYGDLANKFGIKYKAVDVKTNTTTFMKDGNLIYADLRISGNHFLTALGSPYYNVSIFSEVIGE